MPEVTNAVQNNLPIDATPAHTFVSINIKGVSGNVKVGNRIYTNNDPVVLSWNVSKDYGTEYKGFLSGPWSQGLFGIKTENYE